MTGGTRLNVVNLIGRRFDTEVCSLYMLDFERANLVLSVTIGLQTQSVGKVSMRLDEGLVGLVAETVQPQFVADATTHPRFKYFPDAGEDRYHSFLSSVRRNCRSTPTPVSSNRCSSTSSGMRSMRWSRRHIDR